MSNSVYGIRSLRAKVRGFQAEGTSIQRKISTTTGLDRAALWEMKRVLGDEQRYYLLAYGLLRGLKYKQIESNARRLPDPKRVLDVVLRHDRYRVIPTDKGTRIREWTLEDIEGLLKTESTSE